MSLTPSEALVERLCTRSFLSLWTYANPRVRAGKELCDVLVVCDPDVIAFSVKDIALAKGESQIRDERWHRKAIQRSLKQLYGAERVLRASTVVETRDGTPGLPLPPIESRRFHRVAVALGGEGKIRLNFEDHGKGYAHVFDEAALDRVMGELDTVEDFVSYLRAKEILASEGRFPTLQSGEQDLLAAYLQNGRAFPGPHAFSIEPGAWELLVATPEWARRKAADKESYIWDGLVQTLAALTGVPGSLGAQDLSEREQVLRIMARENRFARRVLAKNFNDVVAPSTGPLIRARMVTSESGVAYVFLATDGDQDREARVAELQLRCFVARGLTREATTVVGLATERFQPGHGFSLDAVLLTVAEWTEEHERRLRGIQAELAYFVQPITSPASEDEYPSA